MLSPSLVTGVAAAAAAAPRGWSAIGPLLHDDPGGDESPDDAEALVGTLAGAHHPRTKDTNKGGNAKQSFPTAVSPAGSLTKCWSALWQARLVKLCTRAEWVYDTAVKKQITCMRNGPASPARTLTLQ